MNTHKNIQQKIEHTRRILPTAYLPPRGGISDSETHQVSLTEVSARL